MRYPRFSLRVFSLILTLSLASGLALRAQTTATEQPVTTTGTAASPTIPGTSSADRWEKDIADFEAKDKASPPPKKGVVFVGSSSFHLWKTMEADFSEVPVINRGFGGSKMPDLERYADRIVIPYDPRVIVIYAGSNDINSKKTPTEVMEQTKVYDAQLRKSLPDTIIIHVSLNPTLHRLKQEPLVREFNKLLADYVAGQPKMIFVDTYSKLLGPDGLPQAKMLKEDQLHPSTEGYQVFTATLKPVLLKAYKDNGGTLPK